MVSQAAGAMHPPMFRESLSPKSISFPVVSPVIWTHPSAEISGSVSVSYTHLHYHSGKRDQSDPGLCIKCKDQV